MRSLSANRSLSLGMPSSREEARVLESPLPTANPSPYLRMSSSREKTGASERLKRAPGPEFGWSCRYGREKPPMWWRAIPPRNPRQRSLKPRGSQPARPSGIRVWPTVKRARVCLDRPLPPTGRISGIGCAASCGWPTCNIPESPHKSRRSSVIPLTCICFRGVPSPSSITWWSKSTDVACRWTWCSCPWWRALSSRPPSPRRKPPVSGKSFRPPERSAVC